MSVQPGDTFYGDPRSLGSQVAHLWVVVAVYEDELDRASVLAVLVSATTATPRMDRSCVLLPGDHPFIHHESCMYYQKAVECPIADLAQMQPHTPVSRQLLVRIRQGLHRSPQTKRGLKAKVPKP